MLTFLKYALFFAAVLVVFLVIASFAFTQTMGGSAGVIGWYMEYDNNLGEIAAFKTNISFYREGKLYRAQGVWSHHAFYPESRVGVPGDLIARILPDEDLQLNLATFDPPINLVVTAVKMRRQSDEFHPYPVAKQGEHRPNPPPKGMIKPGMLECDLDDLPWQPNEKQEPPITDPWHPNDHEDYGTEITNGWPRTWIYKSNDSELPDLRVLVQKGRVTQVSGGAEDTGAVDYAPQEPPPDSLDDAGSDSNGRSWLRWLIGLVLGK